jgi:hypothetical protein
MMFATAGMNAAWTNLFYFIPDIALWLLVSAVMSVIIALLKFRWILKPRGTIPSLG